MPYDEWEVLYRQRLQVERDLRAGAMTDETVMGASDVGTSTADQDSMADAMDKAGELVRAGVAAVAEVAVDDDTAKALDRAAGREWRWAARVLIILSAVARAVIGVPERPSRGDRDRPVDQPAAVPSEPPASGR